MKYSFCILLLSLFTIPTIFAQAPLKFGIKAGLNVGNVDEAVTSKNEFSVEELKGIPTTTTARPQMGVWLSIPVSEKLSIQPELLWARKIRKYQSSNPDLAYTRFDYLSLPLLVTGNIHPNWRFELGPEISYLLKFSFENDPSGFININPFIPEGNIQEKSIEIGTNLGISYQQAGWSIGARYYRSLSSVQTIDFLALSGVPAGVIKQYHQGVVLSLGYEICSSKS